jgi:hypothetical protein
MTGLKMHWQLIQESDGRAHLNIKWETAHSAKLSGKPLWVPRETRG